eukprot:COSAG06_NODE_731_length_12727_cov_14.734083_3_plen_129_part_00
MQNVRASDADSFCDSCIVGTEKRLSNRQGKTRDRFVRSTRRHRRRCTPPRPRAATDSGARGTGPNRRPTIASSGRSPWHDFEAGVVLAKVQIALSGAAAGPPSSPCARGAGPARRPPGLAQHSLVMER